MRAMRKSKGFAKESKAVLTHSTPKLFPLASELQGALADGFAEGFVGRNGVEPFASPLIWSNQKLIECSLSGREAFDIEFVLSDQEVNHA